MREIESIEDVSAWLGKNHCTLTIHGGRYVECVVCIEQKASWATEGVFVRVLGKYDAATLRRAVEAMRIALGRGDA